jgi:hypothetical protein
MVAHTCSSSQLQKQKEGDQEMQRRDVERTKNLSEEEKTPQPFIVLQKSHHQSDDEEYADKERVTQKTEGINREAYHRIPPSLLSPTRTNLLLPRTLFEDVVVKGETEASETREAEEREERKKERKKKQRAKGATAAAAALKTNRQKKGGVQKNQHTEWIGRNWFDKTGKNRTPNHATKIRDM